MGGSILTATAPVRVVEPQAGFQRAFLSSPADIVIGGGAAGAGKSFALLMDPLRFLSRRGRWAGTCFRRTFPEIHDEGGLWDTSTKLYTGLRGAEAVKSASRWNFANGRLRFGHIQYAADLLKRSGSQVPWLAIDEMHTFEEEMFWALMARNRTPYPGIRPYMRATCNPMPGWLGDLIDWWIGDDGYPRRDRSGVLRYFARTASGELVWSNDRAESARLANTREEFTKSFTFIPGTLEDNAILRAMDPGYEAALQVQTFVERERLLHGNWKIRPMAGNVFPPTRVERLTAMPWNFKQLQRVRYWDKAATVNRHSDWTVGVLMAYVPAMSKWLVANVTRVQLRTADRQSLMRATAEMDGYDVPVFIEQEPGSGGNDSADSDRRYLHGFTVTSEKPTTNKLARATALAAQWQAGNVAVLNDYWTAQYMDEMMNFPDGPHDDDVDASSGAFRQLSRAAAGTGPDTSYAIHRR
jgi:predicted phage terminase large subunit-like protein